MKKTDEQRKVDLNKVWDYLYKKGEYTLCNYVSYEIGVINDIYV